ncbi:hypothetical protein FHL15_008812 [Xylaria flabelliformis]|uniref:Uncharacterized protein n=1 Tax=Xylaria flabelliformis TaxID=2512241 RepID=A0A553HQP9_9PEZI|nr:hypothetical protein FHL15_008812 [Xylaria flabelliformis]
MLLELEKPQPKTRILRRLIEGNLGLSAFRRRFSANYSPEPETKRSGGQGNPVTCLKLHHLQQKERHYDECQAHTDLINERDLVISLWHAMRGSHTREQNGTFAKPLPQILGLFTTQLEKHGKRRGGWEPRQATWVCLGWVYQGLDLVPHVAPCARPEDMMQPCAKSPRAWESPAFAVLSYCKNSNLCLACIAYHLNTSIEDYAVVCVIAGVIRDHPSTPWLFAPRSQPTIVEQSDESLCIPTTPGPPSGHGMRHEACAGQLDPLQPTHDPCVDI